GHLGDDLAGLVQAVDAEASRLTLDPPRRVLESTGWLRQLTRRLRSDVVLRRRVADAGDPQPRRDDTTHNRGHEMSLLGVRTSAGRLTTFSRSGSSLIIPPEWGCEKGFEPLRAERL